MNAKQLIEDVTVNDDVSSGHVAVLLHFRMGVQAHLRIAPNKPINGTAYLLVGFKRCICTLFAFMRPANAMLANLSRTNRTKIRIANIRPEATGGPRLSRGVRLCGGQGVEFVGQRTGVNPASVIGGLSQFGRHAGDNVA
jgi:hypothetical protein